eukprot:gene12023-16094_t
MSLSKVVGWLFLISIVFIEIVCCDNSNPITFCGGKGYVSHETKECVCITGRHGNNCQYKYCPFGKAWFAQPLEDDTRNMPLTECSNMGECDMFSGVCKCKPGFEGRACERTSCPTNVIVSQSTVKEITVDVTASQYLPEIAPISTCSGHGMCLTMREMGKEFNGRSLIRAPVDYNNWEADMLQGCVCDEGWEGYDCSSRVCPKGRDPLSSTYNYDVEERFVLQCLATEGYFSLLVLGQYTEPIPYDADPGLLKQIIESIYLAGTVNVEIKSNNKENLPTVCRSDAVSSTIITFDDYFGSRPPILINRNTSNTRQWPDGSLPLAVNGISSGTALRMATQHYLICEPCSTCGGYVYFVYGNSITEGINITQSKIASIIEEEILGLQDLQEAKWTSLSVQVNFTGNYNQEICNPKYRTTTTISIFSDYGNIPFLSMIDGSYDISSTYATTPSNITFQTNGGNGTLYECSNQGTCDHSNGVCLCAVSISNGVSTYRAISSDGHGSPGSRGDCGYLEKSLSSCTDEICGPHGFCSNSSATCQCYEGWYGINCNTRFCPKGRSWFDEPVRSDTAHQLVECSGMGTCDRSYGRCKCRDGFKGQACQIRDCPRNESTGEACSGHGRCVSMAMFYSDYGLSYGNYSNYNYEEHPSTWDSDMWHECICMAQVSAGFFGDIKHPSVGPNSMISGTVATSDPLPGWRSWDCSLRNCPKGDDTTRRNGYGGQLEIQKINCVFDATFDQSNYFILSLWGQQTERIYTDYTLSQ